MNKKVGVVFAANDPFGRECFNKIVEQFGDPAKINKLVKGRFEKIVAVFNHRTMLAYEVHRNKEQHTYNWERRNAEERLKAFRTAEDLCNALQILLDEKKAEEAKAPAKKVRATPAYSPRWR